MTENCCWSGDCGQHCQKHIWVMLRFLTKKIASVSFSMKYNQSLLKSDCHWYELFITTSFPFILLLFLYIHRCRVYRPLRRWKRTRRKLKQMWNQSSLWLQLMPRSLMMVRLSGEISQLLIFKLSVHLYPVSGYPSHLQPVPPVNIFSCVWPVFLEIFFSFPVIVRFSVNSYFCPAGAWETKVSNREKRQQRRKDKGPEDSGSSGGVDAPKTHMTAPVTTAPTNTKKSRGSHGIHLTIT